MINLIDKMIGYVAPAAAVQRAAARQALDILNTGYSHGGASRSKTSMKGWPWRGGSTREDIELNLPVLRQRCRDLHMNAPIARAIIGRKCTNVIGAGLRPRFIPDVDVLSISAEEAVLWGRQAEREFMLWAGSTESDQLGLLNFFENQFISFSSQLLNGDSFVVLGMEPGEFQPYELRLHVIEADRVCNPMNIYSSPAFRDGVEINPETGRVLAYHVRTVHPLATGAMALNWESTRITVRGAISGRLNILHLLSTERAEQYRGVPVLSPVIEHIKQLSRYSEAELMAAVISAFYTVFIKTAAPHEIMGESATSVSGADGAAGPTEEQLALGPGVINILQDDESTEIANPSRPNVAYNAFVEALAMEIGAATDIPRELMLLQFNTSYTAARAAMVEAWKSFEMLRSRMVDRYCNPICFEWMDEAVLKGRIIAPGYFVDPGTRAAWRRIQWNGPGPGQINEVVEVKAAQMRVEAGFSTFAREAQRISGVSFDDIIQVQTDERQRLAAAGVPIGIGNNAPLPQQNADGSVV